MFGSLGAPELLLIFIVALLVFGPKRLPEIGRKVGGIVRELRRTTGDFRATVEREIGLDPASTGVDDARRARRDLLSAVSDPLRDAASGAMGAVRDVRDAVILPPGREGAAAPSDAPPGPGGVEGPGAAPGTAPPGAVSGPVPRAVAPPAVAPPAVGPPTVAPPAGPASAAGATPEAESPDPAAPPPGEPRP